MHSPGYARSSDMYTHVGTEPRRDRPSSRKGSKKSDNKTGVDKEPGQRKEADYVRHSPLLSALSASSLSSLDLPLSDRNKGRPLPMVPVPSPSASATKGPSKIIAAKEPKTSPLHKPFRGSDLTLGCEDHSVISTAMVEPTATKAEPVPSPPTPQHYPEATRALTQDLYVVMEPVAEPANHTGEDALERTGSEQLLETVDSPLDAMNSGEYVKFSKDRFWLDAPTEKQRKELEEELKLSGGVLQSHAWYHGHIPWQVAESLVENHGDFLIRDSLSSQGDHVLTSRWTHKTLHFLVSKVAVRSGDISSRVQYALEGERFNSVPALIHFYAGNRTALTLHSGAEIHRPVNRTLPLRYLEALFDTGGPRSYAVSSPSCQRVAQNKTGDGNRTGNTCPLSPSHVHHKGAVWSCELGSLDRLQPSCTTGENPLSPKFNTIPQHRGQHHHHGNRMGITAPISAQPQPSPNNNIHLPRTPQPPHPHSCPRAEADTGGSHYEQPSLQANSYVERLCAEEGLDSGLSPGNGKNGNVFFLPEVEKVSVFRPSRYRSKLLPRDNKPLEMGVLRRRKELLAEVDAKTAAKHITKADCMVARILGVSPEMQRRMGVSYGIELLTLPHGHQLRLDLLERFVTMSIMLAVDVLGCTGTAEERAALLHKAIQIAAELKSSLGNLFGFAAIMRALELPQISRLEQTWMLLRQRHTEGAILYEKTLKPFMKSLNDGKESCPLSNTCFPHVVPLLYLLEKSVAVGEGVEPWETVETGVEGVMSHLGAARTIAQLGGVYHTNAETQLQGFQEQPDIQELFLTEFQMRLLWGSRGAEEKQTERYAKFDQVLTALSNKLEPPPRPQ
ncbi:SH2 domain containing 3Cb isoform X1 [Osmerus mordax]|uniref:SH2 domain containing 3Cb isoform X1 n=1 Tax=Osmerus mordax TaxID=8014 RepID=UPI0035101347